MNDLVSIIMPSYNTGRFIKETIESVLDQSYPAWELIIVDDCSTDNTDEIVSKYDDDRIIYLKNKKTLQSGEFVKCTIKSLVNEYDLIAE